MVEFGPGEVLDLPFQTHHTQPADQEPLGGGDKNRLPALAPALDPRRIVYRFIVWNEFQDMFKLCQPIVLSLLISPQTVFGDLSVYLTGNLPARNPDGLHSIPEKPDRPKKSVDI